MITVNFINGRALACRGARLGVLRRILIVLHLPAPFRSFTDDDWWLIRPTTVSHYQVITDEKATARRAAAEEAERQERLKHGTLVRTPGMRIPRG